MLNISSILIHIHNGIVNKDSRFTILDEEHILDNKTDVEFHLYDDWLKATYDDEVIITINDFTKEEQDILQKIKQLIVDPIKYKERKDNHMLLVKSRREKLASLFETPTPINKASVVAETDTTEYTG